jgi:putative ABC transport system permease protein
VATGLVFGITLLLAGISSGFHNEVDRTVASFHADSWIVPNSAPGPFTTSATFPAAVAAQVAKSPGVREADPMVVTSLTLRSATPTAIFVMGTAIGGIGPKATTGRDARHSGELVVDSTLGKDIGQNLEVSGHEFRVVGTYKGNTVFAGEPTAVMPIEDAWAISFASQPLATSVITRGQPSSAPIGFHIVTPSGAAADLARPVQSSTGTIGFLSVLLWIVAGGIIGSIVYLTVIERARDFAVLKATGFASFSLFLSLAIEAIVIAIAAAVVATVMAIALHGVLTLGVEISLSTYAALFGIAVVVGVLASLVGLRRAIGVDPALAFG